MLLRKSQVKLKAKRVSLNVIIFLSWVDTSIKPEERESCCPVLQDFYKSFTTFPEAFRNSEAEILYTTNVLYITFIVCFYTSFNAEYVFIGTPLSTSMIKYVKLWMPLRGPTEEAIR